MLWAVPPERFPGGRTEVVTVPLIAPGTQYLKRWNQLDVNLKRTFRAGRFELQPALEVYNLLNSSVVLNQNQTFGPTLGTADTDRSGRFMKFGAMVKF